MGRSFSNIKIVSEAISIALSRRGYAVGASQVTTSGSRKGGNVMLKRGSEESSKNSSWIPDPVTGYYRPENHAKEIDAAELRKMLLNNKN